MATDWITTAEAAALSGRDPDYIRKLIRAGKVKGRKWARAWQVSRRSLLAYLRKVEKLGAKRGPKPKA